VYLNCNLVHIGQFQSLLQSHTSLGLSNYLFVVLPKNTGLITAMLWRKNCKWHASYWCTTLKTFKKPAGQIFSLTKYFVFRLFQHRSKPSVGLDFRIFWMSTRICQKFVYSTS